MTINFEMPWERYALIAEIIRRCDAQRIRLGKTALQKMIFLLQRVFGVDCDYTYTFYTYGPYCAEVAAQIWISSKAFEVRKSPTTQALVATRSVPAPPPVT